MVPNMKNDRDLGQEERNCHLLWDGLGTVVQSRSIEECAIVARCAKKENREHNRQLQQTLVPKADHSCLFSLFFY